MIEEKWAAFWPTLRCEDCGNEALCYRHDDQLAAARKLMVAVLDSNELGEAFMACARGQISDWRHGFDELHARVEKLGK